MQIVTGITLAVRYTSEASYGFVSVQQIVREVGAEWESLPFLFFGKTHTRFLLSLPLHASPSVPPHQPSCEQRYHHLHTYVYVHI